MLCVHHYFPAALSEFIQKESDTNHNNSNGSNREVSPYERVARLIAFYRRTIFGSIGSMVSIAQSVPEFVIPLVQMLSSSPIACSISGMRLICDDCLLPAIAVSPPLANAVLPMLGEFFKTRSQLRFAQVQNSSNLSNDLQDQQFKENRSMQFFYQNIMKELRHSLDLPLSADARPSIDAGARNVGKNAPHNSCNNNNNNNRTPNRRPLHHHHTNENNNSAFTPSHFDNFSTPKVSTTGTSEGKKGDLVITRMGSDEIGNIVQSLRMFHLSVLDSGYEPRTLFRDCVQLYLGTSNNSNVQQQNLFAPHLHPHLQPSLSNIYGSTFYARLLAVACHHPLWLDRERRIVLDGLCNYYIAHWELVDTILLHHFPDHLAKETLDSFQSRFLTSVSRREDRQKLFHAFVKDAIPNPYG